jgi:hypothetical protein
MFKHFPILDTTIYGTVEIDLILLYLLWFRRYQPYKIPKISFFQDGQILFWGFALFVFMIYVIEIISLKQAVWSWKF